MKFQFLHTVLSCYFLFKSISCFPSDTISIKDAMDKGMISVIATGFGGHSDECIEINIENLIGNDVTLCIEAGRTLTSKDTSRQDILITKRYDFLLSKAEKTRLKIFGMCMKAQRTSPIKGSRFTIGKMADSLLVQLALFIDKFNYRNTASQNAVWVLSDGNPIESIHAGNKDEISKKLLRLMHILTKQAVPWYSLEYEKDSVILFTGKAKTLHGYYEYFIQDNSIATIGIYKDDGHLQTVLFSQKVHSPGKYEYPFTLDVSKWKKGNYNLRLFVDDQLKEKRMITL